MQVHSLVKLACPEASSPRDVASATQFSNRQIETTTEGALIFISQRFPSLPRVDPTPTSAMAGYTAFALLNASPESTLDSRGDLQGG